MSLIPTNPIQANYIQAQVINTFDSGGSDFTTSQNGEGLRTTNNTTGAYLGFNSNGLAVSPDGTTIYNIKPVNILATTTPPDATTFGVNNKIIVKNGANTRITMDAVAPSITITDGVNTNTITAIAGGATNLQSVLAGGNVATGVNATIALANSGLGDFVNPQLSLTNTNATAGNNNGVPLILFNKTGRNGAQGDHIGTQTYSARNYLGTLKEFGRIECVITNTNAPSGDDGSLDFYSCVNGTPSLVFRMNGADNENNTFRPLDMNGQDLKSSSGNMGISTASSSGTGNMTITAKGNLTETGNSVAITSVGTAGDAITLTSAGNINLIPASGGGSSVILTNSKIATLTGYGVNTGSIIDFNGNPDERFNIDANDITLHWNNGTGDQADIVLENDITSLNSAINMNYQTTSGNMGTTIQNIPANQRIQQTDGINNKSYESSPSRVIMTDATRQAKIENSVNGGENRMDLFINGGGGVSAQSGFYNTTSTQTLYLTSTDNANNKAINLTNTSAGSGALTYNNTTDASPLLVESTYTDLKLSAPNTAGSGSNIEIAPAGQLIFSSNLEASSSTGSSGKYLKIKLNGVNYCIPLDFA